MYHHTIQPYLCVILPTIINTAEDPLATSSTWGRVEFTHGRWCEIMNRTSSPPCFVPVYMRQSQSRPVQTDSLQPKINDALRQCSEIKGLSGFMPIRSLPLRTPLRTIGELLAKSYCSLKGPFTNLLCLMTTVADVLCLAHKHLFSSFLLSEELTKNCC